MPEHPPSPRLAEVTLFRATLDYETDRGCALMAAAYVDSQLEELLQKIFVNDPKVAAEILSQSGPLGTFSSRIDAVYLLGWLGRKLRRDLHLIRKIRNHFGHVSKPLDFSAQEIANRCRQLYHSLREEKATPREHFTNAVLCILAQIQGATEIQQQREVIQDMDINPKIKQTLKAHVARQPRKKG